MALTIPASASALEVDEVGTFDRPVYVTSDPGDADRLFVVEHPGRIQLVEDGDTTEFLDLHRTVQSVDDGGASHEGLLSMAFGRDAAVSGRFYVFYTGIDDPKTRRADESGNVHIDEFKFSGDRANRASRREVLEISPPDGDHHGGQLQFGPDGYLYASTGEGDPGGGDPSDNAQDTSSLLGKILRIDPEGAGDGDYKVPAGNPFAAKAGCKDGCDEIWSYGLRNPWRFSFDRETGALVIADVGADSWEEVNFESGPAAGRGDNFGWDCREGAHDYAGPEAPGRGTPSPACRSRIGTFTEPVFEYQNVDPAPCSITGGYVVRDPTLDSVYGRYVYADLCAAAVRSLNLGVPEATDDRYVGPTLGDVTSFGEDADCRLYVTAITNVVYRLVDPTPRAAPTPTPTLELEAKKQKLRKKLKFFATANLDGTLVAGGSVKQTTKQLAANEKLKVRAKLKRHTRKKFAKELDKKGQAKAKAKVTATASDHCGAATDEINVKLKD